ncbi:MAG: hypothetical protein VX051_00425, partial [Verrucomicrobiota bacterium]|nr:hypothetical protein [Verrucomicrobiota bacterium]
MIGLFGNPSGSESKSPNLPKGYLLSLVDSIFKEGGFLQTEMQLDHRAEQAAMAASVATSLESDQPLLY